MKGFALFLEVNACVRSGKTRARRRTGEQKLIAFILKDFLFVVETGEGG